MAEWAVRAPADRVLEPSCGEAAFLLACADRLRALAAPADATLAGIEMHPQSARTAAELLAPSGFDIDVRVADFFSLAPTADFDVVIGNPPYVRYQDFAGPPRARARAAALRGGVRLSGLASSWAAFTVHAAHFLRPGGRLALVLPAELLSTNYAAEVRGFLMRRFAAVRLVLFTERVFPGVQEEVVLVLAEGEGPTDHCELRQVQHLTELAGGSGPVSSWRPAAPRDKWTAALLDSEALADFRMFCASDGFTVLQSWGETSLGAVTGNNGFFALTDRRAVELGLDAADLVALSPPGSRHLRRLRFDAGDWRQMREHDGRVWLFRPVGEPSPAARRYIAIGEAAGVDRAYKCRNRDPWWRTPIAPPADLLVTYMNADLPRLTVNAAGVIHLNSVHGLALDQTVERRLGHLLGLAALNSVTGLGAETVGRAYGGGMLKLEPREADRLPVPSPALVAEVAGELSAVRAEVAQALSDGRLGDAIETVDRIVLRDGMGGSAPAVGAVARARTSLAARRSARGRPVRETRPAP